MYHTPNEVGLWYVDKATAIIHVKNSVLYREVVIYSEWPL